MLRPARCYQHDDAGPRPARIAAAELVGGRTRRPNVYDKKSQRYAKDNRTAFNCTVARNDKSVAYVTNNKRLCSTFVLLKLTADGHDSRASCCSIYLYITWWASERLGCKKNIAKIFANVYPVSSYVEKVRPISRFIPESIQLLWNANRNSYAMRSIEWYYFQWPWMTVNPNFKGTPWLINVEYT